MNVAGMGLVHTRGRGIAALEQALEQGWVAPATVEVRGVDPGTLPVYPVSAETLTDKTVLAKARRADRFTRMSVLAACDALDDSGLSPHLDRSKLGVIVGTALGPHATTFSFLDGILDFGDAAVSPTAFSHSVHNAAASYIAMTLEARGPTLTVTHFRFAFHQALILADIWLAERRCDAVLVGVTEELGAVMQHVCARMLHPAADGRIKPFAFSQKPEAVPGEGSAFFLVTREAAGKAYGNLTDMTCNASAPTSGIDLQILDACGLTHNEQPYRHLVIPTVPVTGYAPLFGSIPVISGFHAAVAALMLKQQRVYAAPVRENPATILISDTTGPKPLSNVLCSSLDDAGRYGVFRVTNGH